MPVRPIAEGLARGWKTYNGSRLDADLELEADVVGGRHRRRRRQHRGNPQRRRPEGAAGGRGPLKTSSDSRCREADATPSCTRKASAG